MARVLPRNPRPKTPDAELRVRAALGSGPKDWTVLHSVAWQGAKGARQKDGETDFVVLHPRRGILIVEVKGGGIFVSGTRWRSRDRDERVHWIKDPFEQARRARAALRSCLGGGKKGKRPIGYAVWLPDMDAAPALGPRYPRDERILLRDDLERGAAALNRAFDCWKQRDPLSSLQIERIVRALAPTETIHIPLADQAIEAEERLIDLTAEQIHAFDATRRHPRLVVLGGAGTGKTVLASEKARQLSDDGETVLLTCFNRLLCDSLDEEHRHAGVVVQNFHGLCVNLANSAEVPVPEPIPDDWWDAGAPQALRDAARKLGPQFDSIVVDEAQDFLPSWLEALESLLTHGADSRFYLFADLHQELWRRSWSPPRGTPQVRLKTNCRNTQPIARRAHAVIDSGAAESPVSGRQPTWIDITRPADAPHRTRTVVAELLAEEFPPSDIAVICESGALRDQLQNTRVGNTSFCGYGGDGVLVESIRRFKGLESLAAVVVLDGATAPDPDTPAYVAFSRAVAVLRVLGHPKRRRTVHWR